MIMAKISVIIPVYNTEKYLRFCLDSIRRQTLDDIEVIVVDDGSNDSSPAICDDFAHDKRFQIFHNANKGVSKARNFGIERATGKYCMFVDSDDWLDETMCETMLKSAEKNNADLVICGNYNEATSGTTQRHLYKESTLFVDDYYTEQIVVHTLGLTGKNIKNPAKLDKLTPIWARLYRTSIIQENNIQFIDLHKLPSECMQFNFEFCVAAKSTYYVDKVLYHYRRNTTQSVTKPYRNDLLKKWLWWIDYENDYIDNNHLPEKFMDAFYSRICCSVIPLGGNAIKLGKVKLVLQECRNFLKSPIYRTAFAHFDYSMCPLYWRAFFWSAKTSNTLMFFLLTKAMRKILERRKK